jgi:hypothetical protein
MYVLLYCGICTGVRLLPPGENPIAVRNNNNNYYNYNNNNYYYINRYAFKFSGHVRISFVASGVASAIPVFPIIKLDISVTQPDGIGFSLSFLMNFGIFLPVLEIPDVFVAFLMILDISVASLKVLNIF